MIVYRLAKTAFAHDLSGTGAEIYGGRWNSKGLALLYTAQSQALAYTELAIRLPLSIAPRDYSMVTIQIPNDVSILQLTAKNLPKDWRANPHPESTRKIGDGFVKEGEYLVLQVPSAIVPGESNFLVNPRHPQARQLKVRQVELFEFDSRSQNKED
jgi:RES domain-containing protein